MKINLYLPISVEISDEEVERLIQNFCKRWEYKWEPGFPIDDQDLVIQAIIDGVIEDPGEGWVMQ